MSEAKESSPNGDDMDSGRARLKDKAPAKPRRRGSSIPAALVTSTTASKIPPAPRPPRPPTRMQAAEPAPISSKPKSSHPKSSRAKSSRAKSTRAKRHSALRDRITEQPVAAAATEPQGQKHSGAAWVWLAAAGVLAGGVWLYQQRSNVRAETNQPETTVAANAKQRVVHSSSERVVDKTEGGHDEAVPAQAIDLDAEVEARDHNLEAAPRERNQAQPAVAAKHDESPAPEATAPGAVLEPGDKFSGVEAPQVKRDETAKAEQGTSNTDTAAQADSKSADASSAAPAVALPPFDAQAAKNALTDRATQASSCRRGDDPKGTAEVIVTFAPSGRVTSANVNGEPFGGTATGGCIASTLRQATIPAFSGKYVTVRKLVRVR